MRLIIINKKENYVRPSPCANCDSSFSKVLFRVKTGKYIKCLSCGLISVETFPSDKDMVSRANYWAMKHHQKPIKVDQHFSPLFQKFTYGNYLEKMESFRKTGNVLDIGCGIGSFVYAAQERKWNSIGIDIGPSILVGNRYQLNLLNGKVEDMSFENSFFDVITLFDVIEHIIDLQSLMSKIGYFIREKGLIIIKTPNFSGLSSRILGKNWPAVQPQDHMHLFTPKTLHNLLEKFGFVVIKIETQDLNIFELLRLGRNKNNKDKDQLLKRNFINIVYSSKFLREMRNLVNYLLNILHLGESIIIYAEYCPLEIID
ncbi:MAG: class I SAM-dependent methyltransferase [Syntrophomonadaceae bacterium]|nr:class I SAM-dependent methyltransferase [Brevefilum fermentans]HQA28497.1 class I SAM-dependent methyltransferase [Brevefilum fermentans]